MRNNPTELWAKCLQAIEEKVQPQSFHTWFGPTVSRVLDPDRVVVEVPNAFFAEWLEEHYASLILDTIQVETSWKPTLEFVVRGGGNDCTGPVDFTSSRANASSCSAIEGGWDVLPVQLNRRFRFDRFVVGEGNELSYTAAKAVARAPGKTPFNPLFLYGGVGLGKTHLLQAIGEFCLREQTASNVVYVTADRFISEYISSIRKRDTTAFVRRYRSADVLLVDDIQFFFRTQGSQREFLHTFNALYQNEKQIVISSDCEPGLLKGFTDSLVSRFQSGLVSHVEGPNIDTRVAILLKKATEREQELPHEVAHFLAKHVETNIRKLEGELTRLIAVSELKALRLSVDLARETLMGKVVRSPETVDLEQIQDAASQFFNVSVDLLASRTRKQEVMTARHVCMYLCKSITGAPLKAIGNQFGNRDHSTVFHACRTVEKRLANDPAFEDQIHQLEARIMNSRVS